MFVYGSSGVGEPLYAGGITPDPPTPGQDYQGLGLILFDPLAEAELEASTTDPSPAAVELELQYDPTPPAAVRTELLPAFAVGAFAVGVLAYLIAERI